jgi:hypothetical protein
MPGSMRSQPGARWGSLGNWAQHTGHGQTMRQVDLQGGMLPADMAIYKPGESALLEPLRAFGNMHILQVQGCHRCAMSTHHIRGLQELLIGVGSAESAMSMPLQDLFTYP